MTDVVKLKDSKQAIRQQASEWLVKVDQGNLTADEQRALNAWTKQSRLHYETLTQMAQGIDRLTAAASSENNTSRQSHPGASGKSWRHWAYKAAAALALAVVIPVFYYVQSKVTFESTNGEYYTQIGRQKELVLVDGSVITLNTDSRLIVNFQDGKRLLNLLQGEANFDVAPDPDHPFIVRAGKGDVQALGTSFAVRLKGDEVDVLVSHGTVRVRADESAIEQPLTSDTTAPDTSQQSNAEQATSASSVVVGAGKRVIFDESIVASVSEEDQESLNRHLYWRKGYLAFKDQPLSQVVAEVSRYTTYEIILSDASLGDIRVGGYYPIDNIETVFSSLEINLGLQVEKQGENTFFIKKNS